MLELAEALVSLKAGTAKLGESDRVVLGLAWAVPGTVRAWCISEVESPSRDTGP